MRLTFEQQNILKEKYGVDRLWSYSRLSTFTERPWEYKIVYLDKSARSENVYGIMGTIAHDIIQGYYEGQFKSHNEMVDEFDNKIEEWRKDNRGFKFPSKSIEESYINNVRHYFANTSFFETDKKVVNELPVVLATKDKKTDRNVVLIGYADSIYVDGNGVINIVDYKTSSKSGFSGASLKDKSKQLMLYAIALHQMKKIPFDKINLRFDMMKYFNVSFLQKNGKWSKPSSKERAKFFEDKTTVNRIKKLLVDNGEDETEADLLIENAKVLKSFGVFPDFVKSHFKFENCYIDVQITEEDAEKLTEWLVDTVRTCLEYEADKDNWDIHFPEPSMEELQNYYYNVLAPQIREKSVKWQENKQLLGVNSVSDSDMEDIFEILMAS